MSIRLTVKVANIGRGVPTDVTRANMTRVRRSPLLRGGPQAVLWQELDDDDRPDERAILDSLYGNGFTTWPHADTPGCHVPVTLPAPWRGGGVSHKVSDGIPKITPDRYVTVRKATHPDLSDPIAFVSFQLVAGAFTNPGQAREDDRKRLWDEGWSAAKSIIHGLDLEGATTFYGADTNNPRPPPLHRRDTRVLHHSLDVLGYVEGSTAVRVRGKGVIPLTVDGHDALWCRVDLSSKN